MPRPDTSRADAAPGAARALAALGPLLRGMRPVQWTKNAAVLAPLVFARRLHDVASVRTSILAIVAFSAIASAAYLLNDLRDRDADRAHPVKRLRPVAAGELSARTAAAAAVVLVVAGGLVAVHVGAGFAACAATYVAIQIAYSTALKHVVIVDVFAIASGFVIRVVAGAVAIDVPVSNWLYLCTLLLALFLALTKRFDELTVMADDARRHRRNLADYDAPLIHQLVSIAAGCTVLAYALYTMAPETVQKFGTDRLKYTVPFVLFGLFRYLFLVHRRGSGGQPERVLLRDRPTQLNLVAYVAVVLWALYLRP